MIDTLIAWTREQALPFWASAGFDEGQGRFHERLDWDGKAIKSVPIRVMVQARQIYVFAESERLGWLKGGGALAERAMASLQRDFCDQSSGIVSCASSIDVTGRVVSSARDSYAHAFILFAVAHLYRLNGDARLLEFAEGVSRFVASELTDPRHGGLVNSVPTMDNCKRQNPHMHLLEAYLALASVAGQDTFYDKARHIVDLFQTFMYQPRHGVVLEVFATDWNAHPDIRIGTSCEPGHSFEWVWLLNAFERAQSRSLSTTIQSLYNTARRHGPLADEFLCDEMNAQGQPLKRSIRLWPHTEALKAAAVMHERGDAAAQGFANSMARLLLATFLGRPLAGGWIDQFSEYRQPSVDYVPASSLYHLFFAVTELSRVFGADGGAIVKA